MSTLVIAEHDGSRLRPGARSALAAAREIDGGDGGGAVAVLLLGSGLGPVAEDASRFADVVVADDPSLAHPTADRYAAVVAGVASDRGATTVVADSTTFAKDILPRVAAMLGGAMASDVARVVRSGAELVVQRPAYAGAVNATVAVDGTPRIVTVRASAFAPAAAAGAAGRIEPAAVDAGALPAQIEYVGTVSGESGRPELTEARVVVSGGRPFRTAEEFEDHVGRLADLLGGATGCTRALVDAGIAPNEWQVGQTGKVVAPELYFALGVSGAVQHMAGMKNSRVVVAVNTDRDAPVFSMASYGLVGDVKEVVPALIEELQKGDG